MLANHYVMARANPPTDKQLDYLRILGWTEPPPATISDALDVIDQLKRIRDEHRTNYKRRGCVHGAIGCFALMLLMASAAALVAAFFWFGGKIPA